MLNRMTGGIGFVEDIATLVSDQEQLCMRSIPRGAFDLRDWAQVHSRVALIQKHLRAQDGLALMPPGGWPAAKITMFDNWVEEGAPKQRAAKYASFFRAIDAQTEYYDVYGQPEGLEDLGPYYGAFFGAALLQGVWQRYVSIVPSTPILKNRKKLLWEQVLVATENSQIRDGLLKIDEWLCTLVGTHFVSGNTLDDHALFDAFDAFGADRLPFDTDRADRVRALGDPSDYRLVNDLAQYHRMDSRSMWFYWFGHIQCTIAALKGIPTAHDATRSALLAAIFVGQTIDTAYRVGSDRRTRPAYTGPQGRSIILATAGVLLTDPESAMVEMEDLFLIAAGAIPPT